MGRRRRYIKNTFERYITYLNQLLFDLQSEKSDIEEQVRRECIDDKKRKRDVDIWFDKVEVLRKRVDELNNVVHLRPEIYRDEISGLIEEIRKHKKNVPLVFLTKYVGDSFEENMKKMWKLVSDDQVFIIGVHGMGGVGKTLLATRLENEIKRDGSFKDVFWVTVSRIFNTTLKLQHAIANRMGVKLDGDEEKIKTAEILSSALETKEKAVLILDDVWEYIDLEKVGIRRNLNGIKVIVTTRLKHVCHQMGCLPNNLIEMETLDSYNAEKLFRIKLGPPGRPIDLPPKIQKIATCIVERCDGLPLEIIVIATTFKGLTNSLHEWKYTLNKFEKLEMGQEVEENVFNVLKRSYDNLMEKEMQNCFLYCALFPGFRRRELIMKLVENGLINGRSLEEIFYQGNTILDKLIAHSLCRETLDNKICIYRPVTDMACLILKESQRRVMVKFATKKAFFKQEWKDLELVAISIEDMEEEIPEGTSPHCPHLSTLILSHNFIHIPECFFINMNALTVLDISKNLRLESLPDSLSDLRSLVSLTLYECFVLKYVPSLEKLQALSTLVISHCLIEQVPQGLEKIINLKWLDLSWNENLSIEPRFVDVIPNLRSMQYLDLRGCPHIKIKVEDVQGMNSLEYLGGTFLDCKHYNRYVEILQDQSFGPKTYSLFLEKCSRKRILENDDCWILPTNQRHLYLCDNNQWFCLCEALSSKAASTLSKIEVDHCKELKSVFCLSSSCSFCIDICNLKCLNLKGLESLTVICKDDAVDVRQTLSAGVMFPYLTYFHISGCHEIKKLLTPWLVLQLPNLECITVTSCDSMEEIIAVGNGGDNDCSNIKLPKLTTLELWRLPQLKTVCKGSIIFGPSPTFSIESCPNLEWNHPALL